MNIITNDILIENITRFRGGQLFNQTGSSTTPMSPCIVLFNNEQVKAGFVNPSHSNIDFNKAVMVLALGIPGGAAGQAINQAPNNESVTAYAKPFLYWPKPKKDIKGELPLTADKSYTPDPEGFPAVNISFDPSASYLVYVGSVLYTNTFNAQGITIDWIPFVKPGDELTPVLYKNIWYRLTSDKAYALTNGFTLLFVQRRFYSDTDKDVNGNGISDIPDSIVFNTYALITAPRGVIGGLDDSSLSGYVPNGSGDESTTTLKNKSLIVAYDSLPIPVATTTELSSGLLFTYVLAL